MHTPNQQIKPLTTKVNEKGNLETGGCDLVELAKEYSTPLYVVDEKTLRETIKAYKEGFSKYADTHLTFASKALMNKAIAKIFASEGFGFDVVSGGEIYTVYEAGVDMKKVTFNGNNKSVEEIIFALEKGVGRFSVDNFLELSLLNEIAKSKNKIQKILLRITPGLDCHTHEYIQTGHLDSKFGFDLTQLDEVFELLKEEYKNLEVTGLHAHVGSQIFELRVFEDEVEIILKEFKRIKEKYGIELYEMNLGGGWGVKYTESDAPPSIFETAEVIISAIEKNVEKYDLKKPALYIEPGRSLVCNAGITLYTIGSSKTVPKGKKYVTVDGGMADNPRPSMYQAIYEAQVANKPEHENVEKVTIAGRYCESGDILIKDINLPLLESGDILCVFATGAYNFSMASNYNRVCRPCMVLVNNGKSDIIVRRETYEYMSSNDVIPDRLS